MTKSYRILPLGEAGVTFEFGNAVDLTLSRKLQTAARLFADFPKKGIRDVVVTLRSFSVLFDPLHLCPQEIIGFFQSHSKDFLHTKETGRLWQIPCCYEPEMAPDLDHISKVKGISPPEIIALHQEQVFDVLMIGFLPGFAYMGMVAPSLQLDRLDTPRTRIPAGSVALAQEMTAIYPSESPGGWNLIGRCPLKLFEAHETRGPLFQVGDQVQFQQISAPDFETIQKDVSLNRFDVNRQCLHHG